jgi:DNA-binding CsgD family transcriptional regulator
MSAPSDREALFAKVSAAFARGEYAAMRGDVDVEVPGHSQFAGHHRGYDEVAVWLRGMRQALVPAGRPIEYAHEGDDMVAGSRPTSPRLTPSSRPSSMRRIRAATRPHSVAASAMTPSTTNTATAVLAALRIAREHGSAEAALRVSGIEMPDAERYDGLAGEFAKALGRATMDEPLGEAVALGFLAGRLAVRRRGRIGGDPTSFVIDRELIVQGAEGQSILRLPWFEDGLFVGRQLPHISEMPAPVRNLCIERYSAALVGVRGRFVFDSYGHTYSVDAVPVRGEDGGVEAVLAIALPGSAPAATEAHPLTRREIEVLRLASGGLTSIEIADELVLSAGTVKTHLQNIYAKLGVNDRTAAVATALRSQIID